MMVKIERQRANNTWEVIHNAFAKQVRVNGKIVFPFTIEPLPESIEKKSYTAESYSLAFS